MDAQGLFRFSTDILPSLTTRGGQEAAGRGAFRRLSMDRAVPGDRYPQAPETISGRRPLFWARIGIKTNVEVVPWSVYAGGPQRTNMPSAYRLGQRNGEAGYGLLDSWPPTMPKPGAAPTTGAATAMWTWTRRWYATVEFGRTETRSDLPPGRQIVTDDVGRSPVHYKNIWASRKDLKVVPSSATALGPAGTRWRPCKAGHVYPA